MESSGLENQAGTVYLLEEVFGGNRWQVNRIERLEVR